MTKKLLPKPVQSSSVTDKNGKPTSHHYRWMDGVNQSITSLDSSLTSNVSTLTTDISTLSTQITSLTNTVNNIHDLKSGTARSFVGNPAAFHDFTVQYDPKLIVVMFTHTGAADTVSSQNSVVGVQLGTSSGIDTSVSYSLEFFQNRSDQAPGTIVYSSYGGSFFYISGTTTLRYLNRSVLTLTKLDNTYWTAQCFHNTNAPIGGLFPTVRGMGSGQKTFASNVAGPVTTVRIMTSTAGVNITSGIVNILYQ